MNSPKKNGTKPLIILLLIFILPIVTAKIVLSMNLYQGGATNKGELLSIGISYVSLAMENPKPKEWQLLYLLPEHCDQLCQDRLYILQQSHVALGREQNRVHTLILLNAKSDISALSSVSFDTVQANTSMSKILNQQQMIIVDPLGSLIIRYPSVSGRDNQVLQGKALISDLRKLLKLSRVG